MSSLRVAVEWLFGDVSNSFKFIDFKKNLKLRLSAVGKFYVVPALIRNILTCLYGNTTSKYFQIDPPTINLDKTLAKRLLELKRSAALCM